MIASPQDVRLIVFDVDGTLVDDNQVLSEKTIDAIRHVQDQGIAVSLATGKIFPSIEMLLEPLNIKEPVILANGAIIQKPYQEMIFGNFLDESLVKEITCGDHNFDCDLALFAPEIVYVENENHNTDHISVEFKEPIKAIGGWQAVNDRFSQICKAIWINRKDFYKVDQLTAYLKKTYDGRVSLSTGAPGSIEVMPVGVSKQSGLMRLVDSMQIPIESVMVFGDQINDLGMMEVAGISIAMGNAIEQVKEAADYVIGTNNDEGVAQFLMDFFHYKNASRLA